MTCVIAAGAPAESHLTFRATVLGVTSAPSQQGLDIVSAAATQSCGSGLVLDATTGNCVASLTVVKFTFNSDSTLALDDSTKLRFSNQVKDDLASALGSSASRFLIIGLESSHVRRTSVHGARRPAGVQSFGITWTPPVTAKRPLTLSVTNPTIGPDTVVYARTGAGLKALPSVAVRGKVSFSFSNPSVFVFAKAARRPSALAYVTARGTRLGGRGVGGAKLSGPARAGVRFVAASSDFSGRGGALVTATGQVATYGDVAYSGSLHLGAKTAPVVAIATLPRGDGYLVADRDGGVTAFGKAIWYGSLLGGKLASPIAAIVPSADGHGYLLVEANGALHSFGDAPEFAALHRPTVPAPVVGGALTGDGTGLLLVEADGGVLHFGRAQSYGDATKQYRDGQIVGIVPSPSGVGYALVTAKGTAYRFGDGTTLAPPPAPVGGLDAPVVAVTS